MVCAVGDEAGKVLRRVSFPTRYPEQTIPQMIEFFRGQGIAALGIGSFGPLSLRREAADYGAITSTPKVGWKDYPLLQTFRDALRVPVEIDTDVNAAALAECTLGAAKGLRNCLYVTVGTGVGGGVIAEGQLLHGMLHPELGHLLMQPAEGDPCPQGYCPYHQGCLEGCACGPAIEKRWGKPAKELPPDHPAWEVESDYLAQLCVDAVVCLSPERIILGGGVMHQRQLYPKIREKTRRRLGGYIRTGQVEDLERYIVAPGLGDDSGIVGALLLARRAEANRSG